jgi:hypothetical protein
VDKLLETMSSARFVLRLYSEDLFGQAVQLEVGFGGWAVLSCIVSWYLAATNDVRITDRRFYVICKCNDV